MSRPRRTRSCARKEIALAQKIESAADQLQIRRPELDPVIYFEDGSIARHRQQHHDADERQADRHHHRPGILDSTESIISMANGAYLDTKNNILTMADGTKIDTITGLKITV